MIKQELNKTLVDRLEDIIAERILGRELGLGDRIDIAELKNEFGTSPTPIRDALNRLAQRGLVTVSPRVGYYVRTFAADDIEDIYNLRKILEVGALQKAMYGIKKKDFHSHRKKTLELQNRTTRGSKGLKLLREESPHLLVIKNCGNRKLQEAYFRINDYIGILDTINPKGKEFFEEHLRFIDALETGDLERAKTILGEHIENSKRIAKEVIRSIDLIAHK